MDLSTIPLVSTILDGLAGFVAATGDVLEPLTGSWAPLLAIVVLTVLVRLLLLPVGVSQVRAERTRRRLAPELAALRKRYVGRPEELNRAVIELYQRHGTSPVAGCLPLLAQAPVVSAVYALFVHQDIAGHANTLLSAVVGGVPLGSNLFQLIGTTVTVIWPFLVVLLLLGLANGHARHADRSSATCGIGEAVHHRAHTSSAHHATQAAAEPVHAPVDHARPGVSSCEVGERRGHHILR